MRNKLILSLTAVAPALIFSAPAHADITGTVDATITLSAGCIVNGQSLDDGAGSADFGTIDFGAHNTFFVEADSQILNGGSALQVQCSPGIAPTLSFNTGQHDGQGTGAGLHAMAHSSAAGQYVTYNLYSDAGRSILIPVGGGITLPSTGAAQTVNIYGRAYGASGLVAGSYSDVITVVLEL